MTSIENNSVKCRGWLVALSYARGNLLILVTENCLLFHTHSHPVESYPLDSTTTTPSYTLSMALGTRYIVMTAISVLLKCYVACGFPCLNLNPVTKDLDSRSRILPHLRYHFCQCWHYQLEYSFAGKPKWYLKS